jgi:hypothetical protein
VPPPPSPPPRSGEGSAILPPVSRVWRVSRRWETLSVAAVALELALVLIVAAYVFAAIEAGTTADGVVAVVVAVAIAGTGLLYAFRLGAGGIVD